MATFHITTASLHIGPHRAANGDRILAHMTVVAGPFAIYGVRLTLADDHSMGIQMPNGGRTRRIAIPEASDRLALLQAAIAAYSALAHPADLPPATALEQRAQHEHA